MLYLFIFLNNNALFSKQIYKLAPIPHLKAKANRKFLVYRRKASDKPDSKC